MMSNLCAKWNQNSHSNSNNSHEDTALSAKAVNVSNLLNPWNNSVQKPKGDDILASYRDVSIVQTADVESQ